MIEKINHLISDVEKPLQNKNIAKNNDETGYFISIQDYQEVSNALEYLKNAFANEVFVILNQNVIDLKNDIENINDQIKTLKSDESEDELTKISEKVDILESRPAYDPEISTIVKQINGTLYNYVKEQTKSAKAEPAPETPVQAETSELSITDNVVDEIRTNMIQVINDMCDYTKGYNKCSSENERLESENQKLREENSALKTENKKLNEENSELENLKSELNSKNTELEETNSKLDAKNAELEDVKSELNSKNTELEETKSELNAKIKELSEEIENLKKVEEVPQGEPEESKPEEPPMTETNPETETIKEITVETPPVSENEEPVTINPVAEGSVDVHNVSEENANINVDDGKSSGKEEQNK